MATQARKKTGVSPTLISSTEQLARIRKMSVGQLQELWLQLRGEPTRSRNKKYLQKTLSYHVQEKAEGGLTPRARAKIEELAKDAAPQEEQRREDRKKAAAFQANGEQRKSSKPRDSRIPKAGTVLEREHGGKKHKVTVREHDFEYLGESYSSLSSVAGAITGSAWNGYAFFGLHAKGAAK